MTTTEQALNDLLQAIDTQCGNGMIPWPIEDAYAAYQSALSAAKAVSEHVPETNFGNIVQPNWYCIDKSGMATLCADMDDALQNAKLAALDWPNNAPYRAVQLCEYHPEQHLDMVQPQAQGEADYYADARTWYEWSTQTNWHCPKWDDFSPLGLARVEKEYQDALAVEQAWRLLLQESPLWANDARSRNIFASGFYAGSKHPQASEPVALKERSTNPLATQNQVELTDKASEPAWMPIETAPKSEEVLLFATKNRPHAFIGYWGEYNRHNGPSITHWMPLPAAPEATK